MTRNTVIRGILALAMSVLGNLQAWDSDAFAGGLLIVFLVSLAIALPPIALLVPLKQVHFVGTIVLSLILLILARVISPVPLPGLFLVIVPAAMGLIFTGYFRQNAEETTNRSD